MRWLKYMLFAALVGCNMASAGEFNPGMGPGKHTSRMNSDGNGVPFSPDDLSDLLLWVKSDAGLFQVSGCTTAAVSDTDPVGCWEDQSSNGNHIIQATASKRPQLKLAIQNSMDVIRFDGTDDALTDASVALGGDFTVFVVFFASANGMIMEHSANGGTMPGQFFFTTTGDTIHVFRVVNTAESGKNLSASWGSDSTWRIVTHKMDGTHANHELYIDGVEQVLTNGSKTTDPGTSVITDELNLFSRSESSLFLTGDVAEFLVYDATLSSGDQTDVETYLNDRFAIF